MNIERIDQVIASIRGEIKQTETLGFNMNFFLTTADEPEEESDAPDLSGRGCGTIACIAGHAYALRHADKSPEHLKSELGAFDQWSIQGQAEAWLDLEHEQAQTLFYGRGGPDLEHIQPEQAILVLETLKRTGTVDWSIVTDQG